MGLIVTKQVGQASVPNSPPGTFTIFLDTDGIEKKKDELGIVTFTSGSSLNDAVRVSVGDTTPGYLNAKIAGEADKITITKINPGANESFVITVGTDVFDLSIDDADAITEGNVNLFLTTAERTKIGDSLTGDNVKRSITIDSGDLQLVNDVASPGNVFYYGTNGSGTKGFHVFPAPVDNYFKAEVVVTTVSNNFNSNTPTDVPGMTYTIIKDGDYIFYGLVNCNNDENEELDMYFAKGGTTDVNSIVTDRQQKNNDQSIQGTYPIDGLVVGDVITVQFNTRGDNVDLQTRRMLVQSWV